MKNTLLHSAVFFDISDLRERSPLCRQAVEIFFEYSGHDVTFGDANRTLIDIGRFLDNLENAFDAQDMLDEGTHPAYDEMVNFLSPFIGSVYIDLEN